MGGGRGRGLTSGVERGDMRPQLLECSSDDQVMRAVISAIESLDCTPYFSGHIRLEQSGQKAVVARFQQHVCDALGRGLPAARWATEYQPSPSNKDSLDIFGRGDDFLVAVELDKHRADQVAKKFVSRIAILPATRIYYVSLCYPGTDRMNASECQKYFGYFANLSERMRNHFAGFIIR